MNHKTLFNNQVDLLKFKNKNHDNLTSQLDLLYGDFDQTIINEIVLWKVGRYAELKSETIKLLNSIDKSNPTMDLGLTRKILRQLIETKGIGLAMASTILRFKNPNIYQIIDQRAFRIIHTEPLKIPSKIDEQIDLYLEYLNRLREVCKKEQLNFSESDRILYWADKEINRDIPIHY